MSEANQFKGLPSRQEIYKLASGCGLATRTMEPSERLYQFAEKLIGYAVKLRKEYEDGETFMRQRDTAYQLNREYYERMVQHSYRVEQARQIITELVAFCERPEIVAATDGAFDPDAVIQRAKRFLSGDEG